MSATDSNWKRLGDGSLISEEPDSGLGHIVPLKVYNLVFATLIVCTVLTVWVALHDFGVFNLVIALGIASFKAAIVTLYFMHLNWENKLLWGIVIYPIFIFVLIIGGTLGDSMVRDIPTPLHKAEFKH